MNWRGRLPKASRSGSLDGGEHAEALRIREARPEDIPALAQLHVETFKETHGRFSAPTYELRERQWRTAFESQGDWFCYVVEGPRGELVGFAKGTLHDGGVPGF